MHLSSRGLSSVLATLSPCPTPQHRASSSPEGYKQRIPLPRPALQHCQRLNHPKEGETATQGELLLQANQPAGKTQRPILYGSSCSYRNVACMSSCRLRMYTSVRQQGIEALTGKLA